MSEPESESVDLPLEPVPLQFDAPLHARLAYEGGGLLHGVVEFEPDAPRPTAAVRFAGQAATNAAGGRAPRRAAAVVGPAFAGAQHNWIPTGPRNVGGRVSALAIHPANQLIMYAGAASGGVHKSIDGGETWFPLWHDEPSLAVGAIGICRNTPATVYAATGEVQTGGGEVILGDGIYRSDNDGQDWVNPAVPHVPGAAPNQGFSFDAIAVHPTNRLTCWAVGPAGILRTTDGGANWTQFDPGVYYSDVAFSVTAAALPIVYLVRGVSAAGETTVIRLNLPDAADAAITAAIALPANASNPIPVPGVVPAVLPGRGKIAISASNPDRAFVRIVDTNGGHVGVFRTQTARAAAAWVQLLPDHPDWASEVQGTYNLSIAVSPANPNHVATGMLELYVSTNADGPAGAVAWLRAMAWDIYHIDRAHHADNHAAVFANQPGAPAGTPPALWVANDGGISRSTDWSTGVGYPRGLVSLPLPANVISWRKRSHGISASQMYDLTQSPVPTMFGCGFQDNGIYVTAGGGTWRLVLGADGGFILFDPDDPYHLIATWIGGFSRGRAAGGIADVIFPGRLQGTVPAPGDAPISGLWPRAFTQGFLDWDTELWAADSTYHPRKAGRVLHCRVNRLYGTTGRQGDRFAPEPVGRSLELMFPSAVAAGTLEVEPTPGARRLGLVPQVGLDLPQPQNPLQTLARQLPALPRARSWRQGPYTLADRDELHLRLNNAPRTVIRFRPGGAIRDLANASVAEVAAYIRAAVPGVEAWPSFWGRPLTVEITTDQAEDAAEITLGGTAMTGLPGGRATLGLVPRTYHGDTNRQASVTLIAVNRDMSPAAVAGPPLTLDITIGAAGAVRTVTFAPPAFANPASIHAGELEEAIRVALGGDAATVSCIPIGKSLLLQPTVGPGFTLGGTALGRLNLQAGAQPRAVAQPGLLNSFNLAVVAPNPALTLIINDGVNPAATLTFAVAAANVHVPDLRSVSSEELRRMITRFIAANGLQVRCDLTCLHPVSPDFDDGPTEITYSRGDPNTVWVGGPDGVLFRSQNDGATWEPKSSPALRAQDRKVEAIAIHPNNSNTVFAGLYGRPNGAADPGFLFRTRNGGDDWVHVGADVHDAAGTLVGINAIEIDTGAPDVVFAATDVGVFRSTDGGDHWNPFNEGLPNTLVRDLDFVPSTRTLRAGAWGRGTYERHVGDRVPRDVNLYVRASHLDDGSERPAPRGLEGYATTPQPAFPAESPDVKVNRLRPPGIGIDELVDGVEFDEDIAHEEPSPGATNVFVQVHNRGSFPATGVRVVALWADGSNGPPALPATFWAEFAKPGPIVVPAGAWTLLGDQTLVDPAGTGHDRIEVGYPRVHTIAGAWPADIATRRRIGILVLVTCADDPIAQGELDVATLLAREPKAAYRETPTVAAASDGRLFLRATTPLQFTVANPAAPTPSAAAGLGLAVGGPISELAGGLEPFVLNVGAPQGITLTTTQNVTVNFNQGAGEIANLGAATAGEVMDVLNREFARAGVPLRCQARFFNTGNPPPNNLAIRIRIVSFGAATFIATGGTAAPNLGLAVGGAATNAMFGQPPAPAFLFNLAAGAPQNLTIQATNSVTALFRQAPGEVAALAAATAREVRGVLNRALTAGQMPVRAVVPRVDFWVRRSSTDVDGRPATLAGRALADLVVEAAAVAAGPARAALFDLVRAYGDDRLTANVNNFVYLRSANLGVATEPTARHRIFQLAVGATPIATNLIGAAVNENLPAGGSAIAEFTWNPGVAAAGDRLFVLAVVDHDSAGRRLDPPASFASIEDLDTFCNTNTNAAYREFTVGP